MRQLRRNWDNMVGALLYLSITPVARAGVVSSSKREI